MKSGSLHDIDGLELQRRVAIGEEVTAIEAHVRLGLDDLAHGRRNRRQRFGGGVVVDTELKHRAPLAHAAEIADARL